MKPNLKEEFIMAEFNCLLSTLFKPPSFMLLTPNGRFETQTNICLSISNHHPEHWQPSWSVRTALTALIAFMPTSPNGALGSLDYKKEERRVLALKSREAAPKYGTPDRQSLINEIHEYMISKAPPVPQQTTEDSSEQVAGEAPATLENTTTEITEQEENLEVQSPESTELQVSKQVANDVPSASSVVHMVEPRRHEVVRVQKATDDRLFTWAAVGLTIAIVVLIMKKFLKASGHGAVFVDES